MLMFVEGIKESTGYSNVGYGVPAALKMTGSYGNLTLSEGVWIVKYRGTGCITGRVKMQNTRR